MQLSCNYVHGFKRPSMFIFGFHLNCVSKSCDHKSSYEEASILVEHGPKEWNSVVRLRIFQGQLLSFAVFIKFKSQNITTALFYILLL